MQRSIMSSQSSAERILEHVSVGIALFEAHTWRFLTADNTVFESLLIRDHGIGIAVHDLSLRRGDQAAAYEKQLYKLEKGLKVVIHAVMGWRTRRKIEAVGLLLDLFKACITQGVGLAWL